MAWYWFRYWENCRRTKLGRQELWPGTDGESTGFGNCLGIVRREQSDKVSYLSQPATAPKGTVTRNCCQGKISGLSLWRIWSPQIHEECGLSYQNSIQSTSTETRKQQRRLVIDDLLAWTNAGFFSLASKLKQEMEQQSGQQLRQKKGWKRARRRGASRRRSSVIFWSFQSLYFRLYISGHPS